LNDLAIKLNNDGKMFAKQQKTVSSIFENVPKDPKDKHRHRAGAKDKKD
jgi:hypothetical protein